RREKLLPSAVGSIKTKTSSCAIRTPLGAVPRGNICLRDLYFSSFVTYECQFLLEYSKKEKGESRPDSHSPSKNQEVHQRAITSTGNTEREVRPEHPTVPPLERSSNGDNSQHRTAPPAEQAPEPQIGTPEPSAAAEEMANQGRAPLDQWEELRNALTGIRPVTPSFEGLDHEDPEDYLRKCEAFFTRARIDEDQKVPNTAASTKRRSQEMVGTIRVLGPTIRRIPETRPCKVE
ncbi:unnamed protein product, partial [Trichogramma brassicae]